MSQTLSISLNGTTDLPPGKIAAIVTSLEMTAKPAPKADPPGTDGLALDPIAREDIERYLAIYERIGAEWLWFSRLMKPRGELADLLAEPKVMIFALRAAGEDAGLLELDFRQPGEAELAFFGVGPALVGRGAGRWLMNRALELAWARPIRRFWVHTCTLDHPAALTFYQRSGFRAFRRGVEVADDPRLAGVLPRQSAAFHPVIEE